MTKFYKVWEEVCTIWHRESNSLLWKEFDFKLKMWYLNTPLIISSYVKEIKVELCWRKCGKTRPLTYFLRLSSNQRTLEKGQEETDQILPN